MGILKTNCFVWAEACLPLIGVGMEMNSSKSVPVRFKFCRAVQIWLRGSSRRTGLNRMKHWMVLRWEGPLCKGALMISMRAWMGLKALDFLSREGHEKLKEGHDLRVAGQSTS